jgi:hypothetical protein
VWEEAAKARMLTETPLLHQRAIPGQRQLAVAVAEVQQKMLI